MSGQLMDPTTRPEFGRLINATEETICRRVGGKGARRRFGSTAAGAACMNLTPACQYGQNADPKLNFTRWLQPENSNAPAVAGDAPRRRLCKQ
jgi:hypothetical protein